jgi:Zn-dependent protease/CBS domain-containing protein
MQGSFRVGNLFGIPFYINPSWFFVLALVTFTYGSRLAIDFPGLPFPWLLGFITAILLFASVLAHELGHSLVAIRQGIQVKSITLFIFGGLANLEKESKTPGEAFWVAIAGPLVSLMLFLLFLGIGIFIPISDAWLAIVGLLASINLALALFNLIPGLPLDGGNILKALVWKITGNPYKGVIFASRVGQIVGWLAIISGVIFGQFWNALIGWFLLQNAGRSAQYATVQDKIAGLTAADAINPHSPIVSADISLREFVNNYVIGQNNSSKFLVIDPVGQLVGVINTDDLKAIPTNTWTQTQVRDLTQPIEFSTTVKPQQSLLEVILLLEQKQLPLIPVIRDNGVLVGIVEKSSIQKLLQHEAQVNPA